jgi:hypothetical protein
MNQGRGVQESLLNRVWYKTSIPFGLSTEGDEPSEKNGDYLLSHCYAVPSA